MVASGYVNLLRPGGRLGAAVWLDFSTSTLLQNNVYELEPRRLVSPTLSTRTVAFFSTH